MLGEEAIEDDIVAAVEEVHHRVKSIRYIMVAVCLPWHCLPPHKQNVNITNTHAGTAHTHVRAHTHSRRVPDEASARSTQLELETLEGLSLLVSVSTSGYTILRSSGSSNGSGCSGGDRETYETLHSMLAALSSGYASGGCRFSCVVFVHLPEKTGG